MKLTPITNPVALRLDTTVGTRIFAGDTMIHGDTGWRDISASIEQAHFASGLVYARRVGNSVEIAVSNLASLETGGSVDAFVIPPGFRPGKVARYGRTYWNQQWVILQNGRSQVGRVTGGDYFNVSYQAENYWPTTLPGLPA